MDQDSLFEEYKDVFTQKDTNEISIGGEDKNFYAYSPFALQDAIGEKSVKKIWIEYQKLRLSGIGAEELVHKIIGKIRDMTAIRMGASKDDLGIKDYPYNKSKKDLRNWGENELKDVYTKLVEIYHKSRTSGEDLDVEIERIILSI